MSKPGEGIRTFLAVELPDQLRAELGRLESAFVEYAPAIKWSAPGLLHITVRFLGSVPSAQITAVEGAARAAAAQVQPFTLALSGLGAFPNERVPRVIWVGLAHDLAYRELEHVFALTEDALDARGFPREERAFSPHITLARTRDGISAADRRGIAAVLQRTKAAHDVRGRFDVRELVVMRSDPSRSGPRYTPLAAAPLGAGT